MDCLEVIWASMAFSRSLTPIPIYATEQIKTHNFQNFDHFLPIQAPT